MPQVNLTKIKYAGAEISSVVLLNSEQDVVIAPTMFITNLAINGDSSHTITNYGYRLNTYFDVLNYGKINWKDVEQEHIDTYINIYLGDKLGLSESSIAGHIAAISGFYDYAWEFGYLDQPLKFNYRIFNRGLGKTPSTKQKASDPGYIEKYTTNEKFQILLENVDAGTSYIQERNELVLQIGYHLGLRANEVVDCRNLTISKLWDKSTKAVSSKIMIIGKGEKARNVNIPFILQEKIRQFINGRRKNILGNLLICSVDGEPLDRSFASKLFTKTAKLSKDPYLQLRGFHCLRHTFATNLVVLCYERGHDPWIIVPEQMGHSDPKTTFDYVFFEAMLNKRHSIIKKLSVQSKDINWLKRKTKRK